MQQRHNVTRQQAYDAAQQGMRETGQKAFIWYNNHRDGWSWDYEGSAWLGHRHHAAGSGKFDCVPNTDKLVTVHI